MKPTIGRRMMFFCCCLTGENAGLLLAVVEANSMSVFTV